jgi:hypothetical protein
MVGFALPQLIRFRYCLLHPNRVASSASLMFFSLMLSSGQSLLYVSLLFCFKSLTYKKPHRPGTSGETDRLFCCFAERGTGTRPCGSLKTAKIVNFWGISN